MVEMEEIKELCSFYSNTPFSLIPNFLLQVYTHLLRSIWEKVKRKDKQIGKSKALMLWNWVLSLPSSLFSSNFLKTIELSFDVSFTSSMPFFFLFSFLLFHPSNPSIKILKKNVFCVFVLVWFHKEREKSLIIFFFHFIWFIKIDLKIKYWRVKKWLWNVFLTFFWNVKRELLLIGWIGFFIFIFNLIFFFLILRLWLCFIISAKKN